LSNHYELRLLHRAKDGVQHASGASAQGRPWSRCGSGSTTSTQTPITPRDERHGQPPEQVIFGRADLSGYRPSAVKTRNHEADPVESLPHREVRAWVMSRLCAALRWSPNRLPITRCERAARSRAFATASPHSVHRRLHSPWQFDRTVITAVRDRRRERKVLPGQGSAQAWSGTGGWGCTPRQPYRMASGRPLAGHGSAASRDTLIAERIEGLVGQAHARGPPASSSRLTPRARQQAGTDPD
jgi:hypothetical protein